jgi:hypothetical protein
MKRRPFWRIILKQILKDKGEGHGLDFSNSE